MQISVDHCLNVDSYLNIDDNIRKTQVLPPWYLMVWNTTNVSVFEALILPVHIGIFV